MADHACVRTTHSKMEERVVAYKHIRAKRVQFANAIILATAHSELQSSETAFVELCTGLTPLLQVSRACVVKALN
jgi:hypothetical protein